MEDKEIKVSAPGKIILSGEHSVVYGKPAILAAVNRRLFVTIKRRKQKGLKVFPSAGTGFVKHALGKIQERIKDSTFDFETLDIKLDSEIPIGCGMGSSAAFAVAITTAVCKFLHLPLTKKEVNEIAYEIEKKYHNNPSGGDNTVVAYGGFLWYRKEMEFLKLFKDLQFDRKKIPPFILINSGKSEETTAEMVTAVGNLYNRNSSKVKRIFDEIEQVTKELLTAFLQGDIKLITQGIRENETLLEELGVVSHFAKKIIRQVEKLGGAAKICGAGGRKDRSGIILSFCPKRNGVLEIARKYNLSFLDVKLGEKGVRVERN